MKSVMGIGLIIAALFLLPVGSTAASNRCEVVKVDGTHLILACERDNAELKPGDQVKLKTDRKRAAPVEGC